MTVVIQCAGEKRPEAGYFRDSQESIAVKFVAAPTTAPNSLKDFVYAHPDGHPSGETGRTWRDLLTEYNEKLAEQNPYGLFPAFQLYANKAYGKLVEHLGEHSVYILSAGWGLIRSNFLTPQYDITFSKKAQHYQRRKRPDKYLDFLHLPDGTDGPTVFLGEEDYLPLFCELTANLKNERVVFFNSKKCPQAPGCKLKRFDTTTRTNWHYSCADDLLAGRLKF